MSGRARGGLVAAAVLLGAAMGAGCGTAADPGDDVGRESPVAQPVRPERAEPVQPRAEPREAPDAERQDRGDDRQEPAPGSDGLLGDGAAASFAELESRLGGSYGLAVVPLAGGTVDAVGSLERGVAWSTSKVPIAMAALAAEGDAGGVRADIDAAMTRSDNAAAERLWQRLGGPAEAARATEAILRAHGDAATQVESRRLRDGFTAFGQTSWRLDDQARFMARIACSSEGRPVRDALRQTVPDQRWGLFELDSRAAVKGGWGPGAEPGRASGYLVRQMGELSVSGIPVAVAVAALPAGGDFGRGTRDLGEVARWLEAELAGVEEWSGDSC